MAYTYDRKAAVKYAYKYYKTINHKCGTGRWKCTPYGYFGNKQCDYPADKNGDSANFVSQCLLAGGHKDLKGGQCRGMPCGKEETDPFRLAVCLHETFKHKKKCGKNLEPPSWVKPGDVLVYHKDSCEGRDSSVALVTVAGANAKVTSHTPEVKDKSYTHMANTKPFYEWIHIK